MEALLRGSEAVSDELSQRILQADAAARSGSARRSQATPGETGSAGTMQSGTGEPPDRQPSSRPSHGFSFRKAAAAVSAASGNASAGASTADRAAASGDTAAAPASAAVPAQAALVTGAPGTLSGDTDLDVFVAKLTLQALEQQRQAAKRSLESDVWPVGAEPVDAADPPRLDWQSELDLIKRTGETWERRRARMAAERAAAASGCPSDASPADNTVSRGSTDASKAPGRSPRTEASPIASADAVRMSDPAQESAARYRTGSADAVSSHPAGPAEDLDIIDMIAAGGRYEAGSSASENAWLDGGDDSDDDTVIDVTARSSAADDVPADSSPAGFGNDLHANDAARTHSADEAVPSSSTGGNDDTGLPWGSDGRAQRSQQVLQSCTWSSRGSIPAHRVGSSMK